MTAGQVTFLFFLVVSLEHGTSGVFSCRNDMDMISMIISLDLLALGNMVNLKHPDKEKNICLRRTPSIKVNKTEKTSRVPFSKITFRTLSRILVVCVKLCQSVSEPGH